VENSKKAGGKTVLLGALQQGKDKRKEKRGGLGTAKVIPSLAHLKRVIKSLGGAF